MNSDVNTTPRQRRLHIEDERRVDTQLYAVEAAIN